MLRLTTSLPPGRTAVRTSPSVEEILLTNDSLPPGLETVTDEPIATSSEEFMAAISGVPEDTEALEAYLNTLVVAVRKYIDGCDEVGVTLIVDEHPRTAAYTTARTLEIDGMQYAIGDGPCLDAFRNQRENRVNLDGAYERWPAFAQKIAPDGIRSMMAVPLVSGGHAYGALNLYAYETGAFDDFDASMARMAAGRCADAVGAATQIMGARELAAQMEQAMASRAVIEQAKGVLMGVRGITEYEAFDIIRAESQNRNIKVRVLSERIVTGAIDLVRSAD